MGWRHQKRPGLDAFLNSLFDHYEIVVFTSENALVSSVIIVIDLRLYSPLSLLSLLTLSLIRWILISISCIAYTETQLNTLVGSM